MIKKNIAKRQRTTPTVTDLGKETYTNPDWTRILHNPAFQASIFRTLTRETFLDLRRCHRTWCDLPLFHMIERCVTSPMSSTSPDIAQLKDEFWLLQFFHNKYFHNQELFDTQLAIVNKNPEFITTQQKYIDYTLPYTILKQNTDSLSPEQEEKLATLYSSLKTPYQTQQRLKMKAVSLMQESTINPDDLHKDIQSYINTKLQAEKTELFGKLKEKPEINFQAFSFKALTKQ